MPSPRPAAGGGRWVVVGVERLDRWLRGFEERHGPVVCTAEQQQVRLDALDGAVAVCEVPFPPLALPAPDGTAYAGLVEHALRPRRVGILLARLGGHAVGVLDGQELVTTKAGQRHVQGRTAAGGWSGCSRTERQPPLSCCRSAAASTGASGSCGSRVAW